MHSAIYSFGLRPFSLIRYLVVLSVVLLTTVSSYAQSSPPPTDAETQQPNQAGKITSEIKNFGKVNDHYYRGGQPKETQYAQLAKLGIKSVIDLRNDPERYAASKSQQAGLQYLNIPFDDKSYPPQELVKKFMELARDQNNWPIFVHCAGGRHRTGAMTAIYRMTFEGWDIDRAYKEMKDYDFYTRFGHKDMKTFVYDYWKELQARRQREVTEPPLSSPTPPQQ